MGSLRLLVGLFVPFVAWYLHRRLRYHRFEQFKGYPRPPPSLIWGNLKNVHEFYQKGDLRRHFDYVARSMAASMVGKDGTPLEVLFLDMRPIGYVVGVILSHNVAEQLTRITKQMPYSVPKSPTMKELVTMVGDKAILHSQGETWKALRKRYNQGFSHQHLTTLIPQILQKIDIFTRRIEKLALQGEEVSLERVCTNLTFDIIGAVTMSINFNAQLEESSHHPLVKSYRELLITFQRGSATFLITRPTTYLNRWLLGRKVDREVKKVIQEQYTHLKVSREKKSRSVLALSLQEEMNEGRSLTKESLQSASDQLKSFLFAGHDTTSIVLQQLYYHLSLYPLVLSKLRQEIHTVFGSSDPDEISRAILANSDIIKQLPYTTAVIKEALRLHPPAGSARMAPRGSNFNVRCNDGREFCVDGMVLYICHSAIQNDPSIFPDPELFIPERWLSEDNASELFDGSDGEDQKGIPASAFRVFERGPRNCIGQELAMLEAKLVLAITVQRFEFEKTGVGAIMKDVAGEKVYNKELGRYEVEGDLFDRLQITSKPFDGMVGKMRVTTAQ